MASYWPTTLIRATMPRSCYPGEVAPDRLSFVHSVRIRVRLLSRLEDRGTQASADGVSTAIARHRSSTAAANAIIASTRAWLNVKCQISP